jgi:hypothetical protein
VAVLVAHQAVRALREELILAAVAVVDLVMPQASQTAVQAAPAS